jgi:hypothetical protein
MTSIHELAIQRVISKYAPGHVKTGGFSRFFRKLADDYSFMLGPEEYTRRIPDAWAYTPHHDTEIPGTLYLFEVEDSNPLSVEKLREYSELYFVCDFYDLELKLFVFDRYGEQQREIPLLEYYGLFEIEKLEREFKTA